MFLQKDQAIGYAETRARLRTGEIRIFDSTGNIERVIAFDDANRRLDVAISAAERPEDCGGHEIKLDKLSRIM